MSDKFTPLSDEVVDRLMERWDGEESIHHRSRQVGITQARNEFRSAVMGLFHSDVMNDAELMEEIMKWFPVCFEEEFGKEEIDE